MSSHTHTQYAELTGLDTVLTELKAMGVTPAPLLEKLVADGTSLSAWSKKREKELVAKAKL